MQRTPFHQGQEPVQGRQVPAVVQVQDDLRLREDGLDGLPSGVEIFHEFPGARSGDPAAVPEHPVGDFVTHLHPGDVDSGVLEREQDIFGMRFHRGGHRGRVLAFPRSGHVLLAGVGPGVAVMEVNHHFHSERMGAPGLFNHVRLAVPAVRRVHPHAQAHGIQSEFLHQGGAFTLLSGGVVELETAGFHLRDPADVCALDQRAGRLRPVASAVRLPARAGAGEHQQGRDGPGFQGRAHWAKTAEA